MLSTNARLRGRAVHVRSLARSGAAYHRIESELIQMHRWVGDLDGLVAEARLRADRGLDRPLAGCTLHVDVKLREMALSISRMLDIVQRPVMVCPITGRRIDSHHSDYGDRGHFDSGRRHRSFDHRDYRNHGVVRHGYDPRDGTHFDLGRNDLRGVALDPAGVTIRTGNVQFRIGR